MRHPLPQRGSGEVPEPVVGCLAQDKALLITWISSHLLFKQFTLVYVDIHIFLPEIPMGCHFGRF